MYYSFIDGNYYGSSKHISYLKKLVDEVLETTGGYYAVIYMGQRSCAYRFETSGWKSIWSEKKDRPELPEWAKKTSKDR